MVYIRAMDGNDIYRERLARDISQERLARIINVSVRQVSRWETGEQGITEHRAAWIRSKLAEYDKQVA